MKNEEEIYIPGLYFSPHQSKKNELIVYQSVQLYKAMFSVL